MTFIAIHKWLDQGAEPIDPRSVQFTAEPARAADKCRGCLFKQQTPEVCRQAEAIAMTADLPDCEAGFIYVRDRKTDPRQIRITRSEAAAGTTATASEIKAKGK